MPTDLTSMTRQFVWLPVFVGLCFSLPADAADSKKFEFFESRIRPVLVEHCYECHSTGSDELQGNLAVDTAVGLLQGGASGPAVVPGSPGESLLLEALRYESVEMPPKGKLPEQIIKDFEKWIADGANDPRTGTDAPVVRKGIDIEKGRQFWAFQPVQSPAVPQVKDVTWPQNAVDHFILAKLEAKGLKPAGPVDRTALVRRLYFDLVGLPPEPEQVRAFLKDDSPSALETLVDRLLNSPQFGVHWGRHWLDVARYADSNGGDFNATFHDAWRYRDYVVDAFNQDKPYDQFILEQIAGDLLPSETREQQTQQIVATGFLMLGTKMLSERDKDKLRMDVVDEQISSVGSAFLGLTLGCARCHDHKFDPIPTRDYYALAGIFRSTRTLEGESQRYVSTWPRRPLPAEPEHVAAVEAYEKQKAELKAQLAASKKELEKAKLLIDQQSLNALLFDDGAAVLTGNWKSSTYSPGFIGKGYLHDDAKAKGEKSVRFPIEITKTGRYDVRLAYTPGGGRANNVPVTIAHASGETIVQLDQTQQPSIDGTFASVGTFSFTQGQPAHVTISNAGTTGHVIADAVQLVEVDAAGTPVKGESPNDAKKEQLAKQVRECEAEVATMEKRLKDLDAQAPPPLPRAFAVDEHQEIGDCAICIRGEHRNLGEKVPRGFLQVASNSPSLPIGEQESGRVQLAQWIASADNPLTARVMVNRIWYHLMGEGIVRTVDNFGELGTRPTHPELLDYLASDFVSHGWTVKRIIRDLVLSSTYQMSTQDDKQARAIDPENNLYWRAHRRRLPAEAIRDSILSISGQLDLQPGDSPVKGLGVLVTTNDASAQQYERSETSKRSLYLPIIRNELPPILAVFDFADPDFVTGQRNATTVPAQALLLMNSPFVIDAAERTAARLLTTPLTDEQLIERAYESVLCRQPTPEETSRALAYLQRDTDRSQQLASLVHVLFASTEFRFLD